jgi:hypothetical protein
MPASRPLQKHQARKALLLAAALTLLLHLLPMLLPGWGLWLLQWPLLLLSSLVHELGHGLVAGLLGGDFVKMVLWWDGSGVAGYAGEFSALGQAAVSAGGLLGPPLAALALMLAGRQSRSAHVALGLVAAFLVLVVLFWAASLFTVVFCGLLAITLGLLAWRGSPAASQVVCVFLALQLGLSVFSRADYLFTAIAQTSAGPMPSDVAQIAAALWLPYWFWGLAIAGLSLALLALGAWRFLRALS